MFQKISNPIDELNVAKLSKELKLQTSKRENETNKVKWYNLASRHTNSRDSIASTINRFYKSFAYINEIARQIEISPEMNVTKSQMEMGCITQAVFSMCKWLNKLDERELNTIF